MLGHTKAVLSLLALVLAVLVAVGAHAQEPRKAYRHVDAAGNVTYSQTPPGDGKDAKKVDISPAQRGRGGYVGDAYSPYDDPRYYAGQGSHHSHAAARRQAHEQRWAEVRAQCQRQRGTDCDNPATLQYMESTRYPRHGTVVRRPPAPDRTRSGG